MTHRFPIKEIARQAGLGTATVDRVLNNRAHVSPQTRNRVARALEELAAQESQLASRGRRLFVDIVVEAPKRFSSQIRIAAEAVIPTLSEAVYRPRFLFHELMAEADVVAALVRIRVRGSQGVILKARDVPAIRAVVADLQTAGIPVVTLVTDIDTAHRCAYAGLDNASAGRTSAYLLAQMLPARPGTILATRSQEEFQGEVERAKAFLSELNTLRPADSVIELVGGAGLPGATGTQLRRLIAPAQRVDGVYSMGGGNMAILNVLEESGRERPCFIAHDLDRENHALLRAGHLTVVLHHDLTSDMRHAFRSLSAWHGLIKGPIVSRHSDIQIITPHSIPDQSWEGMSSSMKV